MNQSVSKIKSSVAKNGPAISIGFGLAGLVTATVQGIMATPKALDNIEDAKEQLGVDKLGPKEMIQATWTCYLPTVIITGLSIACVVGGSKKEFKRNAALITAYKMSEAALSEYKDNVLKVLDDKKKALLDEKTAKTVIDKHPVPEKEVKNIIINQINQGNVACYDSISAQPFYSNKDKLSTLETELNRQLFDEGFVSLNDVYEKLKIDRSSIGDDLGWPVENGNIKFEYTSTLDKNGIPCLVLEYDKRPEYC